MQPKFVIITLVLLNLIFFSALFLAAQSNLFDLWLTQKVLPHVCIKTTDVGTEQLTFCEK